jgi:hypothetical protein
MATIATVVLPATTMMTLRIGRIGMMTGATTIGTMTMMIAEVVGAIAIRGLAMAQKAATPATRVHGVAAMMKGVAVPVAVARV